MRMFASLISVLAAGALIGCGGAAPVQSSVPASSEHHGGVLIPLTDKQVYVELLNGDRGKKGDAFETTLVAYLLQPDLKTPLSQAPTSVEVKIGTPKGDQVVALKAAPDSADPLGSTRFVSAPGPFELNQVGGEVTVQVGGKTLSGPFRGPR
jgi:hypothetical protein